MHHRGRTAQVWRSYLEAAMPVRGRWLRYLVYGFGAGALLVFAPAAAVIVGSSVMAAGLLLLIQATATYVEGRSKAARRSFSARLARIAFLLILIGAALFYIAVVVGGLRTLPSETWIRV